MSTRSPRIARPLRLVALALACSSLAAPATTGPAAAQEAGSPSLVEVGRLPVLSEPGPSPSQSINPGRSGWLLLDTRNRFAYQVFEVGNFTVVQSFDLDTLRPLRRAMLAGIPITTGLSDVVGVGGTEQAGEVVHAVDEERGRLYLAMSDTGPQTLPRNSAFRGTADGQRHLVRFVMIDEQKFNAGAADFAASFREPSTHAHLHYFNVVGMAVTHVPADGAGRLLVAFAHPAPTEIGGAPTSPLYGHTVARWNPQDLHLRVAAGEQNKGEDSLPLVDPGAEKRELSDCARATMGAGGGIGEGFSQWGILATADAVYLGCHLSSGNGAVVAVPLLPGGSLSALPMRSFPLAKPVVDVLVDRGGGRLLVRTIEKGGSNVGATVWVFDTAKARYTGAIALKQSISSLASTGVDPATGRLYSLIPDLGGGAGGHSVRGGFQISDTRLDPAPPLENVRPDLAYGGVFSIRVDPPTRRVFLRRGLGASASHPAEPFYRVLRDDVPVAQPPPEIDDAAFTTDTAESDLTRASYLGAGTGYGARALMIGGLDAATTQGAVSAAGSPCGTDDREVLAGSVGQVNLSDLSVSAEAAAIDADARTRRAAPDLVDNCRDPDIPPQEGYNTEELAFDQVDPKTGERTGRNHYAATCLGDEGTKAMEGFSTPNAKTRREAFKAEVTCAREDDDAAGRATGALVFDTAAGRVRVAHSSSEVTVKREAGKGIEVRVDSIARGIDIGSAASIGVVRTTAVSKATGRSGRAEGTFERSICGVTVTGQPNQPSCLGQDQQRELVDRLNAVLGARGRVSLRRADPKLLAGSESGYRSAVQRHGDDLFEDRSVTKDFSIAVPGLELMFFQGDGDTRWGAGRQVLHLAGAQASTSYGITCLYGRLGNGRCARPNERDEVVVPTSTTTEFVEGGTVYETLPGQTVQVAVPGGRSTKAEPRWKTVVYAPARAAAEALRLLFNNPRELGLMAAVWALLYAPCYLGERRRSINGLRARRASVGVGGTA